MSVPMLCGARSRDGRYACDYPKGHESVAEPRDPDWLLYHHHTLPDTQSSNIFGSGAFAIEWPVKAATE